MGSNAARHVTQVHVYKEFLGRNINWKVLATIESMSFRTALVRRSYRHDVGRDAADKEGAY